MSAILPPCKCNARWQRLITEGRLWLTYKMVLPCLVETSCILPRHFFWNLVEEQNICVGLHLFTLGRECIFDISSTPQEYSKGLIEGQCDIPGNFLNDGSYYFSLIFVKDTSVELFYFEECLSMEVEDYRTNMNWYGKWSGYVRPRFPFRMRQIAAEQEALTGA